MKMTLLKYTKAIFIISLMISLFSCNEDNGPDEIFDENSTARIEAQEQELRELLLSSENGWKTTYFTDDSQLGGWQFIFDFKDSQNVTMISDYSEESLEPQTSEYDIIVGSTVKLSFTTKNYIHDLSDANNFPLSDLEGQGYKGDFEFLYYGQDGEDLIFKSNRDQVTLRFEKATPEDSSKLEESRKILPALSQSVYSRLYVDNGGEEKVYNFSLDVPSRFASSKILDGFEEINFGVSLKSDGIEVSPAIEVGGEEITDFVYNENSQQFVGTASNGATAIIEFRNQPYTLTDDYQLLGNEVPVLGHFFPFLSNSPTSYNFQQLYDEANDKLFEDYDGAYIAQILYRFQGSSARIQYIISDYATDRALDFEGSPAVITSVNYSASLTKNNNDSKIVISNTGNWTGDADYVSLLEDMNDKFTNSQGIYVERTDLQIYYTNAVYTLTSASDPSIRIAAYKF